MDKFPWKGDENMEATKIIASADALEQIESPLTFHYKKWRFAGMGRQRDGQVPSEGRTRICK